MNKKPSRQRIINFRVLVTLAEKASIERYAGNRGLSVSAYLRDLGLNYKPKTVFNHNTVAEMVKINGELGQLGSLLKIWLTNEEEWQSLGKQQPLPTIDELFQDMRSTHARLFEAVKKL